MSKRKKNKKRKGFTLIELVAVILILGIIATIAIGTINTKIDDVRKSAYKTSVVNIIKSAENYIAQKALTTNNLSYPVVFTCDGEECKNGDDKLDFKGDVPVSGTIEIDKSQRVSVSYLSNGKYCTSGVKTDLQVGHTCADIDITKPTLTAVLEGKTINLTYNDNVGVTHYCVTTTDNPNTCEWKSIEQTHELQEQGIYYVYVRDAKNNISDVSTIEAPSTAFCNLEIGWSKTFAYKGTPEEFEVPCSGLYQLEVWGAQGGTCSYTGGKGAQVSGSIVLTNGQLLYVVVGGQGSCRQSSGGTASGGYNGGGYGRCYGDSGNAGSGGGGATHIGFENKQLKETAQSNVLIVAGGGGGIWQFGTYNGGNGGSSGSGGSSYGQGGNGGGDNSGGGGGGWLGGRGGSSNGAPGTGGSNYTDSVPEITYKGTVYSPLTTNGANSGNGKAKITLIAY